MLEAPGNRALETFIWTGTGFVACEGLPISDRGFRYGMALFESLAIRNGRVEFLNEHLARLETACRQCGWLVPSTALAGAGAWLTQASEPAFARIYITAGAGGPLAPVTAPQVVLFAEPRNAPTGKPIRMGLHPSPFLPLLGGLKTVNYWANIAVLNAGCDETLLFNPRGELISACMANVFLELDGQLVTPPLSTGARAGVIREWVMARRGVIERTISREETHRVTGCFLTSCWNGVTPVAMLDGKPLHTDFAEALRTEFFNRGV